MAIVPPLVTLLGFSCLLSAALYSSMSCVALIVWRLPRRARRCADLPAVTILKPLCGAEPGLYEDLRSFCRLDYPHYQLIFGLHHEADPACSVARQLAAEYPTLPITVVVDSQLHGSNCKISNLINMLPHARHELLVMADSDALVEPDYLRVVTSPLRDSRIGLVTCIYRGIPTPGIWSRIGAMYINEWYVPSILLAWLFGHEGYVSGQTICIRQKTLRALGGLQALSSHLADDHRLGTLVRALGLRIELSRYVVTVEHHACPAAEQLQVVVSDLQHASRRRRLRSDRRCIRAVGATLRGEVLVHRDLDIAALVALGAPRTDAAGDARRFVVAAGP
jgi:ceramide glucosyltransferase